MNKCDAMFYCPIHRDYFDVTTDEIPSWTCPLCKAEKEKKQPPGAIKPVDLAILKFPVPTGKEGNNDK
jgi:ferredoxin